MSKVQCIEKALRVDGMATVAFKATEPFTDNHPLLAREICKHPDCSKAIEYCEERSHVKLNRKKKVKRRFQNYVCMNVTKSHKDNGDVVPVKVFGKALDPLLRRHRDKVVTAAAFDKAVGGKHKLFDKIFKGKIFKADARKNKYGIMIMNFKQ